MYAQLTINILATTAIFLLVACSFSLIYFPTKVFHLAHGVIISVGAYFTFLFTYQLSLPLSISVILAVMVATFVGILCELTILRRMRKSRVQPLAYLIASLGLYIVLQNCISLYFGDDTKIIRTGEVTVGHEVFNAYISTTQLIIIGGSFLLFGVIILFMRFTSYGKAIRAVSSNPELCDIFGFDSNKIILIAFGLGSAMAAIAGILSALDTNMTPTFGFDLLLYGVVVMVIGGIGSTRGLIVGALLVASAQHLAAYYIDSRWMDAVTYVILILFLIWKPLGFSGKRLQKVEI